MSLPKVGTKVIFIEKIPQDNGAPFLLEECAAKVLGHSISVCKTCHEAADIHDRKRRPQRVHKFEELEGGFLDLEVKLKGGTYISGQNIIKTGRKIDMTVKINCIAEGTGANNWKLVT